MDPHDYHKNKIGSCNYKSKRLVRYESEEDEMNKSTNEASKCNTQENLREVQQSTIEFARFCSYKRLRRT